MIYELSYGSHEDSERYLLLRTPTPGETYIQHIHQATEKVIRQRLAAGKLHTYNDSYQYLIETVKDTLITDYGYTEITPQETWHVFGWASVLDNTDWESTRDDQLNELTTYLNSKGLTIETIRE